MPAEDLMFNVGLVLFLLVQVALAIAYSIRSTVLKMLSSPEAAEAPDLAEEVLAALPENYRRLLLSEGFQFHKAYSFHACKFGRWIRLSPQAPLHTFILNRTATGTVFEFGTTFSDDAGLLTTTTRSAFLFPLRFGEFMQAFPKATPEELWKAHLAGDEFLTSCLGIRVEESHLSFLESLKRDTIARLSHAKSHRLWFVRGIYWYLLKRFMLHNRPLQKQNIPKLYPRAA